MVLGHIVRAIVVSKYSPKIQKFSFKCFHVSQSESHNCVQILTKNTKVFIQIFSAVVSSQETDWSSFSATGFLSLFNILECSFNILEFSKSYLLTLLFQLFGLVWVKSKLQKSVVTILGFVLKSIGNVCYTMFSYSEFGTVLGVVSGAYLIKFVYEEQVGS